MEQNLNTEKEVSLLKGIYVGGIKQYISIKGKDINNPIILFLHGGPGSGQIGFISKYLNKLEENFIVVNWDQRGAGLSYSEDIPIETMTIDQFVDDTVEIVDYLRKEFNKDKIYLVGHSFGSLLGMKLINKYPDLFISYVGVGQFTNLWEMEEMGLRYITEMAKATKAEEALEEIKTIGKPPYKNIMKSLKIQRKWLNAYGGVIREGNLGEILIKDMKENDEYSDEDIENWKLGGIFSATNMIDEISKVNLFKEINEVKIPITFIGGKYDFTTFSSLSNEYLDQVDAPEKEFIWFVESSHYPMISQSEKFCDEIYRIFSE